MRFFLPLVLFACSAPNPRALERSYVGPLPTSRHGHRAELIGDELIVVGGSGAARSRETWIQSTSSGVWRRGADLHEGKSFFATARSEDDLYAVGGTIERYERETDRWDLVLAGGSFPNSHFGAACVGRRIVAVGGYPLERSGVRAFDLDSEQVIELTPPPRFEPGDHFHFVVTLLGRLHVIGGLTASSSGPSTQHWILEEDGSWRPACAPPVGVWSKFAVSGVIDERFYCFVGFDEDSSSFERSTGLCYDPRNDRWHSVDAAPFVLAMPAAVVNGSELIVLGGAPLGDFEPLERSPIFDTATESWR